MKRFLVAPILLAAMVGFAGSAQASLSDRTFEPVVITGAETPKLIGVEPADVVAFSYTNGWKQVPVQVDERKMLDYRPIRQRGAGTTEFRSMGYADPNTWAEADGVPQTETATPRGSGAEIPGTTGDPKLDGDDEIAMLLSDAAGPAGGKQVPAGVDPRTLTEVKVVDPLDPGKYRYLYLFRTTTGMDPSAGIDQVSYVQSYDPPLANGYRQGYNYGSIGDNIAGPPVNPEASVVKTNRYEIGIPARWMIDELRINTGGATGVDILDGDKSTVTQNSCGRNELTFSRGGGGMIANIDGPVRAIRSFIGANSGTYTQREYVFYEGLFENRTILRVHPGINQFVVAMDLSPAAVGMTYRNELNQTGVPIDGVQDTVTPGLYRWEQFSGAQGTVTNVHRFDIDIEDTTYSSYYQDLANPPASSSMLCSGDSHSYGAAGPLITTPMNNTDPARHGEWPLPLNHFSGVRYTWFDGPETGEGFGSMRSEQVDNPVSVEAKGNPDPAPVKPARLSLSVKPKKMTIKAGKKRNLRLVVRNTGGKAATGVTVCVKTPRRVVHIKCRKPGKIGAGGKRVLKVPVRMKRNARKGAVGKMTIRLSSKSGGGAKQQVRLINR